MLSNSKNIKIKKGKNVKKEKGVKVKENEECPEISACESPKNLFWTNYYWNKKYLDSSVGLNCHAVIQ